MSNTDKKIMCHIHDKNDCEYAMWDIDKSKGRTYSVHECSFPFLCGHQLPLRISPQNINETGTYAQQTNDGAKPKSTKR
jgi:hypothetical protein